jgi:hypothetical protein
MFGIKEKLEDRLFNPLDLILNCRHIFRWEKGKYQIRFDLQIPHVTPIIFLK